MESDRIWIVLQISESFLRRCNGDFLTETVKAGNNNGNAITLNKGLLKSIKIADKELSNLDVLVIEDDMFIMEDSQGHRFEADMLLGYDVINMYKWIYDPTMHTLDISDSNKPLQELTKKLKQIKHVKSANIIAFE